MKYIAITILCSMTLLFCITAQAEDYCYSWDCESHDSTASNNKGMDSNQYGTYGDKGKESKYADKMKTQKKAPSNCDKHKKSKTKGYDPAQKNYLPCVKLY